MTRINLVKYGFIRSPEQDFTDDGNRFTCYRILPTSESHVSKLVSNGQVYLSFSVVGELPYEKYSNLPNYRKSNWEYNGVSLETLTERDLIEFFESCMEFEREYRTEESRLPYPSREEIRNRCIEIQSLRRTELDQITRLLSLRISKVLHLTSYKWSEIQSKYKSLESECNRFDPSTVVDSYYRKGLSIKFCSEECSYLKPSWYFTYLQELINE